ncbi:MAG: hypothetical protein AAF959_11115 [Cyanobacteria bacterium P01_D01_bin.56]
MAIAFSGNTVTITGTEDLASLFSDTFNSPSEDIGTYVDRIAGVEGTFNYDYVVKELQLLIQGTMNWTSNVLFTTSQNTALWPPVQIDGGTLNIGNESIKNSFEYSYDDPIYISFRKDSLGTSPPYSVAAQWGAALINVRGGGFLNILGAEIHYREGNIITNRSNDGTNGGNYRPASITIKDTRIVCKGSNNPRFLIGVPSIAGDLNFTVDDFTFVSKSGVGLIFEISNGGVGNFNGAINGYQARGLARALTFNNGVNNLIFSGFDLRGSATAVQINQSGSKTITLRDNLQGNDISIDASTSARGTVLLDITTTILTGNTLINPKVVISDSDSGVRTPSFTADYKYTGTLVNGEIILNPITRVADKYSDSGITFDNRLPYSGVMRLYGYLDTGVTIGSSDPKPRITLTLLQDPVITLSESAAAALTGIAVDHAAGSLTLSQSRTPSEVYDFKAWDLTQDANIFTTFRADWFISNTGVNLTNNYNLIFSGSAEFVVGNEIITQAANTTVTLGSKVSYTSKLEIPATGTVFVNQDVDLTAFTFTSGATISLASGTATVTVTSTAGINTAGAGTITLQEPQIAVNFTGFLTGNNVNGVAYEPVLAIENTNDGTLFTADASSGSVSKVLNEVGDGVGPFNVWADGVGFRRTSEVSIAATQMGTVDLSAGIQEFTAEDGTAIIGLSPAESGLTYNQPAERFELAPGVYTFLGLAHQKEILTSSEAAQAFDNAAVRAIEFISNDAYKRIILPSPFLVSASESAATGPVITDALILRSDNADPFAHGLSSTAAGLTNRPEVVVAYQAPAAGLTQQNVRDAMKLAPSAGSPAAGSIDAELDALPINPLLTTDARLDNLDVAISTRSSHDAPDLSNLDAPVSSIPTNPLLDTSYVAPLDGTAIQAAAAAALTAYDPPTRTELTEDVNSILTEGGNSWITATGFSTFNPTSDQVIASNMRGTDNALTGFSSLPAVTVATNNDKTGYSLTQAFPSNFEDLAIDGSGNVTAENMRGTDGAITSLASLPTLAQMEASTPLTQVADLSGLSTFNPATTNVTVGGYAAGQSPAVLVNLSNVALEASVQSCLVAAESTSKGTSVLDLTNSTYTKYEADGTTVHQVFDLYEADGSTPATASASIAERRAR